METKLRSRELAELYSVRARLGGKGLPVGVNWELSPLLDFSEAPKLSLVPQLLRYICALQTVKYFGGFDVINARCRILDACAGFAEMYSMLMAEQKARGMRWEYVGVDIDQRKRKRALDRHYKIDYRIANIETPGELLATVGGSYDLVLSMETLEHVIKPVGEQFLCDLMAALKPGGHLIITVPSPTVHRDNHWHQHEWHQAELREFVAPRWEIVDMYSLMAPAAPKRKAFGIPAWRAPNELLRGLPSDALGMTTVAVLRAGEQRTLPPIERSDDVSMLVPNTRGRKHPEDCKHCAAVRQYAEERRARTQT